MIHVLDAAAEERRKYSEIWAIDKYREADSPGLQNVDRFMEVMNPKPGESLIDIGCGSGRAGIEFAKRGLKVWWLDITDGALDPAVDRIRFFNQPLWRPFGGFNAEIDYGFCCDVLEHIPPEYTLLCIDRMLDACETLWLQIANLPDKFGPALLGQPLHLTVQPYGWWLMRIASIATIIDTREICGARDLCGTSLFVVKR